MFEPSCNDDGTIWRHSDEVAILIVIVFHSAHHFCPLHVTISGELRNEGVRSAVNSDIGSRKATRALAHHGKASIFGTRHAAHEQGSVTAITFGPNERARR